jgi:hypothetical protein
MSALSPIADIQTQPVDYSFAASGSKYVNWSIVFASGINSSAIPTEPADEASVIGKLVEPLRPRRAKFCEFNRVRFANPPTIVGIFTDRFMIGACRASNCRPH